MRKIEIIFNDNKFTFYLYRVKEYEHENALGQTTVNAYNSKN